MARKSRKSIAPIVEAIPEQVIFNAAAYTRLSGDSRKKRGDSLETQRDIIENFIAASPDIRLMEVYTDNYATGTNFERPAFQQMLADAEDGKINCIIVKDLSRFGRNAIDAGYYIEKQLPAMGVRFIAINDSFDSLEGDGGILLPLKNLIAESYALDISRKCKSVKQQNIREGRFISRLDCVWHETTIKSILRDEQYTGTYIAGRTKTLEVGISRIANAEKDWIKIPGHHPAIISQETFELAQERFNSKAASLRKCKPCAPKGHVAISSPLKGKVVCGHCGHLMQMSNTNNAAFHCQFTRSASDAACHRRHILNSELEEAVRDVIVRQVKILLESRSSNAQAIENDTANKTQVGVLLAKKQSLYEHMVLGEIGSDEYTGHKASIDAEVERLQNLRRTIQIHTLDETSALNAAKEALEQNNLTQELVDLLIEKILIYPDNRIEIVWMVSGFAGRIPNPAQERGAAF